MFSGAAPVDAARSVKTSTGSDQDLTLVPGWRHARGLANTSVIVDIAGINAADLPAQVAVSTIALAELVAGPLAAS
jgi:hypothetical protein